MYMAEGTREVVPPARRPALLATIVTTMLLVLLVGIAPAGLLRAATDAFTSLR
jgi:hypothetical protein